MVWLAVAAFIGVVHITAIILGRRTSDRLQRTAFASGLLGLLSFAVVLYVGLKSLCLAGACGHSQPIGPYLAVALYSALAIVSCVSAVALVARRSRA
jgi:hypothetical protein